MPRLLGLGVLSALFFSSTFVLNRAMSLAGGHWAWSASLRFFYLAPMLALLLAATQGWAGLRAVLHAFGRRWRFWMLSGSIGFGVFYSFITYASNHTPGWVVATTWQTTILATPLVLWLFGKSVPARGLLFSVLIFAGIVLANAEQIAQGSLAATLAGALPVLASAFAYPIGNQLVWEATQPIPPNPPTPSNPPTAAPTAAGDPPPPHLHPHSNSKIGYAKSLPARVSAFITARIPRLANETPTHPFARVLLLTLGSMPFWLLLLLVTRPAAPSHGQLLSTALVALFSGVVATSLFLYARQLGRKPYEIAAVDSTQAMEVVFSLAGEVLILGAAMPGPLGWAGISLTMAGLAAYMLARGR